MLHEIITFIESHQAAFEVAAAWAFREFQVGSKKVVVIYPYVSENGGVFQLIKNFFNGKAIKNYESTAPAGTVPPHTP